MACYAPLKAYAKPGGGVAFDSKEGFYDRPLQLPCGQCIGCRQEKKRAWAIRCMHEAQMHEVNHFLTLTYNNESLPEGSTLVLDHWQKFAKRVRKRHGPFRFLHCGEYGDEKRRPHYHAVLFGLDLSRDLKGNSYVSVRLKASDASAFPLMVSESLTDLWELGYHTLGQVTFDSAAYVASYTTKRKTGKDLAKSIERVDPETGECWEVKPEYATMSRNPGLGAKWFEKYCSDIYPDNYVVMKGQKFKPPAYYDKLLEEKDPELHKKMKEKRRAEIRRHPDELTPERLEVREAVCEARSSQ